MEKFMLLILTVVTFFSCSTSEDIENSVGVETDDVVEMQLLYNKIDEITRSHNSDLYETRKITVSKKNDKITKSADNIGKTVGSWAGAVLGGYIGSNTGVGTGIGVKLGKWVGGIAVSVAASYLAKKYVDKMGNRKTNTPYDVIKQPVINCGDSLSFGDLHNLIMYRILSNESKYLDENDGLNYQLLISDCAEFAQEYDPDNYDAGTLQSSTIDLISSAKALQNGVEEYYLKEIDDTESLYDICYDHLYPITKIDKSFYDNSKRLDLLLEPSYTEKDSVDVKVIEHEVNAAISSANLPDGKKTELINSNTVLANSSLLWRSLQDSCIAQIP